MRLQLLLILFFYCDKMQAQNNSLPFINYTIKDGLSHNNINCMIRDSRGYMWLGTTEGLNRFDGKHFRTYFNDDTNLSSLKGNNVSALLEYQPGKILIATNKGLSVFDIYTNSFQNEKINKPASQEFSEQGNYSFFQNSRKQVYINYNGKIDVYDYDLKFLYCLSDKPWALNLRGVTVLLSWWEDEEGRLWLPDDLHGVVIIDEKKQQVFNYKNNPEHFPFLDGGPVRSVLYDTKKNTVWYSRWGYGLEKYNLTTKEYAVQQFNLQRANEGRTIDAILKDKDGSFICCGGQDVYRVDPSTLKFSILNKKAAGTAQVALARCIIKSGDDIWIGTESIGLLYLPSSAMYVKQIPVPFPVTDYNNSCTGILHSKDGLIYCAYGYDGLLEINPADYSIRQYKMPDTLKAKNVFRICEDKMNRLLIGTEDGIYLFDKKKKQFLQPASLCFSPKGSGIYYMLAATDGKVWISYSNPSALGCYDGQSQQFTYYANYTDKGVPFFNSQYLLNKLKEDAEGNIWMSSYKQGGIVCYEKKSGSFKNYPVADKNKKLLNTVGLNALYPDSNNIVWLANVYGLGLVKYNYSTDSIIRITKKDGLLSNNILSINKNKEGIILLTEIGLNYYNPQRGNFLSLKYPDEATNWSFANAQFYDSSLNSFIYGLNDRIVFINSNIWKSNTTPQPVFIDDIVVNGERLNNKVEGGILHLTHRQQNIFISFSQPSYNVSNENEYAYKLEGVDEKWNENKNAVSASYSNLSPGNYTLLVKSKTQFNEWGPVNNSLHIIITPAFWQMLWFKVFLLLATALFVYWLVKRRIKIIRREAEMKQQIAETEMMALRAQMNPHFIFNCLNSIDNLIQVDEKEKATLYLVKFAKLIRSILENSKNNVVPCWKDLETLKLYIELEELRCDKKFVYKINVVDEIMNGDYKVPPLVIQPFVENAIHHGLLNKIDADKKLTIDVTVNNSHICYSIEDNGVGRAKAESYKQLNKPTHESMGMQITTDRINLFNQDKNGSVKITDLVNERNEATGTKVEVELSINY